MKWVMWMFLAAALALVVYVEGVANPFSYWNSGPIILAGAVWYWASHRGDRPREARRRAPYLAAGFAILAAAATMLVHLAWWFDWGGTATGSSTSGLIFVVAPLLALLAGGAGLAAGWLINKMKTR